MTTDTAVAESETEMDDTRLCRCIEAELIHDRPDWAYLLNHNLPMRPATEAELAAYAARYQDADWQEIYAPAEPRIILPPTPEITALLEGHPEPAPVAVDDEQATDEAQHAAENLLARWTKGTRLADPETAKPDPDAEVVEGTVVDDPATTRFLEAFKEDPDGDEYRAELPAAAEVHHDTPGTSG